MKTLSILSALLFLAPLAHCADTKTPFWELSPAQGSHPPKTSARLRLRPGHPRLVFGRDARTFEQVRELHDKDPVFRDIFAKALDVDPATQHPAANAACWIVTQDDKYADAAVRTMRKRPLSRSGEPYYSRVWSYALAYDWLYHHPRMTAAVRAEIETKILERVGTELDDLDAGGMAVWHGRNQAANGVMIAALAVGDLPGRETMLRRATAHYVDALRALQYSEGWPEGASYWIYNRAGPYGYAADCVMTAAGIEEIDGIPIRAVIKNIGLWSLYQYGPNGVFEPYGDSAGSLHLGDTGWWVLSVDHYAKLSRDPGVAAGADFLRNRSPDPYGKRKYYWNVVATYDPSARPTKDYNPQKPELWMRENLPQAILFGRDSMGVAYFRGRWGDTNELYASFKAGDLLAHHDHYDTGTFTLQYGGELVAQSGFYGDYTGPHRLGYQVQTVSASSILVLAPGETSGYLLAKWPDRAFLSGGQRVIRPTSFYCVGTQHYERQRNAGPHLERATIKDWRNVPGQYDYIAADITAAYNSTRWSEPGSVPKVSRVLRRFLFLRPYRAFVILDRVEMAHDRFVPRFVLHCRKKPASAAETLLAGSSENGILETRDRRLVTQGHRGRLYHAVLLPHRARCFKIGGPDYCFYAETDGDALDGFDGVNIVEGTRKRGAPPKKIDRWRLEVEPVSRRANVDFLNVLLPRLQNEDGRLPPVRVLEHTKARIVLRVGAAIIAFPADTDGVRLSRAPR